MTLLCAVSHLANGHSPCSGARWGRLGMLIAGSSPSDSPLLQELELRVGTTVGEPKVVRVVREGREGWEGYKKTKRQRKVINS